MTGPAVICDLDGTLCNIEHRLHFVRNNSHDWDSFFAGIPDDLVVQPIADLIHAARFQFGLVLCSGRPERCRRDTVEWLECYGIQYDALYMRPDGDLRADRIVKKQLLEAMREDGYEPFIVIDDRPQVVEMWRQEGLVCLQCAPTPTFEGKAQLTLMVGPSGGGKSHWLATHGTSYGCHPSRVISSDQIRADMLGDFRDQSRNQDVFEAVHAIAKTRLIHGLPTTIDATHLRNKDRIAAATLIDSLVPVRYIVIDRPMEIKQRDQGWRAEVQVKGLSLIEQHAQTFKSNLNDILAGDKLPNVEVIDLRHPGLKFDHAA